MRKKDTVTKQLLSYPDVFADVVNALVFGGKDVVKEENLKPAPTSSFVTFPGELEVHEQLRDVAMFDEREGVIYSLLCIENQTTQIECMPLRVLAYDGAAYKEQVEKRRRDSSFRFYPVITVVLNYSERPWSAPETLHEVLGIRPDNPLASVVSDYRINVIDLQYLSVKEIRALKHDFGIVCQILNAWKFEDSNTRVEIRHREALGAMVASVAGENVAMRVISQNEAEGSMIEGLWITKKFEERWNEGLAAGREEGRATGRSEGVELIVKQLMQTYGWSRQQVKDFLEGKMPSVKESGGQINKIKLD